MAVAKHYKDKGQAGVWSSMTKPEKDAEIVRNKGAARGRGKRFPVTVQEKASCFTSRAW